MGATRSLIVAATLVCATTTGAWAGAEPEYGSARDERRGLVTAKELFATLAEGQLTPAPASASGAGGGDATLPDGFVDLAEIAPSVVVDMRYAAAGNFVGRPVRGYGAGRCLLAKPAAEALARVASALEPRGLRLHIYDCYRPQRAVDDFVAWARRPPTGTRTPAYNPDVPKSDLFASGYIAARSGHTRGSTVDLTLEPIAPQVVGGSSLKAAPAAAIDCRTVAGNLGPDGTLNMGTTFDCFDEQAHTAADVAPQARRNRKALRAAMATEGFVAYAKEWWHFSLANEPFPGAGFDFEIRPRLAGAAPTRSGPARPDSGSEPGLKPSTVKKTIE